MFSFTTLAGIPVIIEPGAHDFVTIEPNPITESEPILHPFKIVAFWATHT